MAMPTVSSAGASPMRPSSLYQSPSWTTAAFGTACPRLERLAAARFEEDSRHDWLNWREVPYDDSTMAVMRWRSSGR